MLKSCVKRIAGLVVLSLLYACASGPPDIVDEPGVNRLNAEQARNHVSDKTEKWREGHIYYKPDGTLLMVWRKIKIQGTWEVTPKGNICFNVKRWTQTCHYYVEHNGEIMLITGTRNRGAVETVEGNHLPSR